jgi:Ca2+-binding RTX toxin-like protein
MLKFECLSKPTHRFIYNNITGALSFDVNGNLAGGVTQLARLSAGLLMTNQDIFVGS